MIYNTRPRGSKVVSPVGRIRGVWPAHRCFTWTSYAAQVESFIPFDVVMTLSEPPFSFLLSRGIIVRGCSVRGFTTEYRRGIRYFTERRGGGDGDRSCSTLCPDTGHHVLWHDQCIDNTDLLPVSVNTRLYLKDTSGKCVLCKTVDPTVLPFHLS